MNWSGVERVLLIVAAFLIALVLTWGVLRIVGEEHKQSCIAEAGARFPVVGNGSNNPFNSGAGTHTSERNRALDKCSATIF